MTEHDPSGSGLPEPAQPAPTPHDGSEDLTDQSAALVAALVELERHIGTQGWDRPARLFALIPTELLLVAEPGLTAEINPTGDAIAPGTLTAVEQEDFFTADRTAEDLLGALGDIIWPDTVFGCALSTERTFLPANADVDLPDDPAAAARLVVDHPAREDVRVVVGVDRAGNRHGVGRLASRPADLLGGADLVPGLSSALAHTLT